MIVTFIIKQLRPKSEKNISKRYILIRLFTFKVQPTLKQDVWR